jgi:maltooligosyltrehalose trehalohydrolase
VKQHGPGRRFPVGAEPGADGVSFRVWAPRARHVEVVLEAGRGAGVCAKLSADDEGYFAGEVPDAATGTRYRFRLDGAEQLYPDPASRFQPEGPHGASEVINPQSYRWTDLGWCGVPLEGQVIYELHLGTFTPEGTWAAAARELPELAETGLTVIEVMPVADFPGRFGWGYDGVCLFAPTRLYGAPDDFRRFVDAAHGLGLGVILDVVYNHLGPDGNYLRAFSDHYFTDRYQTEWGEALNFDGAHSAPVREFFATNAAYWIEEYHLDGLRLDATHAIVDRSPEHIVAAVARRVREAAGSRRTIVVAENEPQDTALVRPAEHGGCGIDALWNDDYHHSALVALTGRREAYYSDHRGAPQEFVAALKWGYLFQGQRYAWQGKPRGTPALDLPPARFVTFLENHDQVANSARGDRLHRLTSPGRMRALTALTLLAPGTPMLFQGQEFAATSPFLYFADHEPGLAAKVRDGRREFLRQFPSLAALDPSLLPDPADPETFRRSRLDPRERERNAAACALHRDLLRLRRSDAVFRQQRRGGLDGAVLEERAFVLRFFGGGGDDRLLLVNLGAELRLEGAPEPLLAPPHGRAWEVIWSSEEARYGGGGVPAPTTEGGWRIPAEALVVLASRAPAGLG